VVLLSDEYLAVRRRDKEDKEWRFFEMA